MNEWIFFAVIATKLLTNEIDIYLDDGKAIDTHLYYVWSLNPQFFLSMRYSPQAA